MEKKKSIFSYYKPYKKIFFADMFFAIMASIITLVIPLVVRYITSTVIYYETDEAFRVILKLGLMMTVLFYFVLLQLFYSKLRTCDGSKD